MRERILRFLELLKKYFCTLMQDIRKINKHNFLNFIRQRIKLIGILVICILAIIGYTFGTTINSRNNVLSKLEKALINEDVSKLKSIVRLDGKRVKDEQIKHIIEYYNGDKNRVYATINQLRNDNETNIFYVEDKKGIKINLKTYTVSVESNFDDCEYTIDDKNYIKSGEQFTDVIPGLYTIKGNKKGDNGDITTSKEIIVVKDETVKLDFDAIYVTVKSDYLDADIYINDVNSGIKVNEDKELGPFKTDSSVKLHLERDFPWGHIKGEEVEVKDNPNIQLSIKMNNEQMEKDIFYTVNNFYTSVFEALNTSKKEKIVQSTEETKEKIYDILEKKYLVLKNSYKINDIKIQEDKNQYDFEDNQYRATIVVEMDYEISKKFFGLNKKENSKKFFTKLIYRNEEWIIEDVENFSL